MIFGLLCTIVFSPALAEPKVLLRIFSCSSFLLQNVLKIHLEFSSNSSFPYTIFFQTISFQFQISFQIQRRRDKKK